MAVATGTAILIGSVIAGGATVYAAQATAVKQINQQTASSRLAIQQSRLQSRIQQQSLAHNVGRKKRARVGTPKSLRTKVETNSALALGGSAGGGTTKSGTGGLNV